MQHSVHLRLTIKKDKCFGGHGEKSDLVTSSHVARTLIFPVITLRKPDAQWEILAIFGSSRFNTNFGPFLNFYIFAAKLQFSMSKKVGILPTV